MTVTPGPRVRVPSTPPTFSQVSDLHCSVDRFDLRPAAGGLLPPRHRPSRNCQRKHDPAACRSGSARDDSRIQCRVSCHQLASQSNLTCLRVPVVFGVASPETGRSFSSVHAFDRRRRHYVAVVRSLQTGALYHRAGQLRLRRPAFLCQRWSYQHKFFTVYWSCATKSKCELHRRLSWNGQHHRNRSAVSVSCQTLIGSFRSS